MDTTQIIGLLAAFLTTAANIPQTYIIIRERSTKHVSKATYAMLLSGTALWVAYGILESDWPIIIANGISSLTSILILWLSVTSKKVMNDIHHKVIPEKVQQEVKGK